MLSLEDVGIDREVEETGETFEENASLKAEYYRDLSGLLTLADDSGLEVDALGGEPGVRSARYARPDASDTDRVTYLLGKLMATPRNMWTARFRCVVAVAEPELQTELHTGACDGLIVPTPRGNNGFGYDPIFLFPQLEKTMAELTSAEKNTVSHRAMAVRSAATALRVRFDRIRTADSRDDLAV